jgi:hypothetical protein
MLYGQFAMAADTVADLHGIPQEEHRRALAEVRRRFLAQGDSDDGGWSA